MDIGLLVNITSRAWALPILAQLHQGTPGRQAALLTSTGAGRTALGQSLEHLISLGLLERNPGHGHPLRPEYRLTPRGATVAATAEKVVNARRGTWQEPLLRKSWTVPILAIGHRPRFFSDFKGALPRITDRALSQSLKQLQGRDWLLREVDTKLHPPRARYRATGEGLAIGQAAAGLA